MCGQGNGGRRYSTLFAIGHELRPRFREGTFVRGGVPDKMSDAERGKFFADIPGRKSIDCATAFILPNFLPDRILLRIRQGWDFSGTLRRRGGRKGRATGEREGEDNRDFFHTGSWREFSVKVDGVEMIFSGSVGVWAEGKSFVLLRSLRIRRT